jgi:transposase
MSSNTSFSLMADEVKQLETITSSQPQTESSRRANALLSLHNGQNPQSVAARIGISSRTLYRWWQQWRELGVEGLAHRSITGRPAKANLDYRAVLRRTLQYPPHRVHIRADRWTVALLADFMQLETGILLSANRLRTVLHEMGYYYGVPKSKYPHPKTVKELLQQVDDWIEQAGQDPYRLESGYRWRPLT